MQMSLRKIKEIKLQKMKLIFKRNKLKTIQNFRNFFSMLLKRTSVIGIIIKLFILFYQEGQ